MNATLPPFVQELLDSGVDAVGDPRTQEWLLDHPEAMPSFAALRRTLIELPTVKSVRVQPARRSSSPWRPVAWLTTAAAAAILAFVMLSAERNAPLTPLPRPDFPASGGVVHSRAVASEVSGTRTQSRVLVFARPGIGKRRSLQHYKSLPTSSWSGASSTSSRKRAVTVRAVTITEEAMIP